MYGHESLELSLKDKKEYDFIINKLKDDDLILYNNIIGKNIIRKDIIRKFNIETLYNIRKELKEEYYLEYNNLLYYILDNFIKLYNDNIVANGEIKDSFERNQISLYYDNNFPMDLFIDKCVELKFINYIKIIFTDKHENKIIKKLYYHSDVTIYVMEDSNNNQIIDNNIHIIKNSDK